MKTHDLNKIFSSKRVFSIIPKLQTSQSKSSQAKQNNSSQLSSTKKYLTHLQKLQPQMDQTQKFLADTKTRLDTSTKHLREFHKKKQIYNSTKQNVDFSILSNEIKATKQKLKNKHFFGMKKNQNNVRSEVCIRDSKNFEDSQKKLGLIEKVITAQEFVEFKRQLEKKESKIKHEYKDRPDLEQKIIQYYLNFHIITRFLQQTAKDPTKLSVKQENLVLYYKMKDEMIGLLSNQQLFKVHIHDIQQSEQNREKALFTKTIFQQERFAKTYSRGKTSGTGLEKTLDERIQELLENSKNSIKEAFANFNKPYLTYQIELQFNKRKNDATLGQ